jgi:hypothetical protein
VLRRPGTRKRERLFMTEERRPTALEILRIPEYRIFITARFFYVMALRMVTTIIGWRIYEITHNPFAIGLIGLSEFLPAFSLALYAGHVIDKSDKRALLLRTTTCYLLCVAGLLALSFGPILRSLQSHWIQWLIYFIIFCTGVIRAFAGPALNAIIAQIVPKEKLPGAVTINTSAFLFASVIGHATAGFLIAHTTYLFAFSIVGLYSVIAWFCFFSISPKQIMVTGGTKPWESIKEGLRFVIRTKEVLGALALDLFAVLFGGAVALIPVYARDILRVGPIGFGWLNAADDIGSIIMIGSPPAVEAPPGIHFTLRRLRLRGLHYRIRPVKTLFCILPRAPVQRNAGWDQRRDPRNHRTAENAGPDARTGIVRQFHVHQFQQ